MQANISHSRKIFDRLVEAAASRGESLSSLSKALGLHISSFYRWKKGSVPHDRTIRLVATELRVREDWLRTGEGDMEEPSAPSEPSQVMCEPEKEPLVDERLGGTSTVYKSRIPPSISPRASAFTAATGKLSEDQLYEILSTSILRLREETIPVLKLGYLATLKACVNDLERRLSEGPTD